MTDMDRLLEKLAQLEGRVRTLEETVRRPTWKQEATCKQKHAELCARYGETVNKSEAAEILGVTRATIYAMLEDGRLRGACERKVSVQSIAEHIVLGTRKSKEAKKRGDP